MNPYEVINTLEKSIAEWCGSKYAVAVESGTAAIFLSLYYMKQTSEVHPQQVSMPCRSYPSVACSIIHTGSKIKFEDYEWSGEYQLKPLPVWDAALRFKKGMYHGGLQCLSFHVKKHLPVGRGGIILMDSDHAYNWLKKARFDGREPIPLSEDNFTQLGFNMYMEPANGARAIQLFEVLKQKHPDGMEDLKVEEQGYPDLSLYPVYQT